MIRPAQTARSERTREALRQAALVRFLAQGVEDTSAEQIAADAGVSLRTFYRHFTSKHDLLFVDYDAGLRWFRAALAGGSPDDSLVDTVLTAVLAAPYDAAAMPKIAELRAQELDPGRIVRHIRQVEADFAEAVEEFLTPDQPPAPGSDERLRITVTARCIAAAVFGAMEVWMLSEDPSPPELTRLCRTALESLRTGLIDEAG
jgi:AcrR family transcriptional regulator